MLYIALAMCMSWGSIITVWQVQIISCNKEIRLINLVNLMYAFVYGLLLWLLCLFGIRKVLLEKGVKTILILGSINEKPYMGELTFFPASGFSKFDSEKYDRIFGDMISLPKKREEK